LVYVFSDFSFVVFVIACEVFYHAWHLGIDSFVDVCVECVALCVEFVVVADLLDIT
jgi:hypothetical protein